MPLPIDQPKIGHSRNLHDVRKAAGCGIQFESATLKVSADDIELIRKLANDDSPQNSALLEAAAWLDGQLESCPVFRSPRKSRGT